MIRPRRGPLALLLLTTCAFLAGQDSCETSDADGDGWEIPEDCDDNNDFTYPGAEEICDGLDNDCDDILDEGNDLVPQWVDHDDDGYGDFNKPEQPACFIRTGFAGNGLDCNDRAEQTYPGADEACDSIDNDCDGETDEGLPMVETWPDRDGDGYGAADVAPQVACAAQEGKASQGGDCDEGQPDVHPGANEQCDGEDDDCDGVVDEDLSELNLWVDADGDGYGDPNSPTTACSLGDGLADNDDDCDDDDPRRNEGVAGCAGATLTIELSADSPAEAHLHVAVWLSSGEFQSYYKDGPVVLSGLNANHPIEIYAKPSFGEDEGEICTVAEASAHQQAVLEAGGSDIVEVRYEACASVGGGGAPDLATIQATVEAISARQLELIEASGAFIDADAITQALLAELEADIAAGNPTYAWLSSVSRTSPTTLLLIFAGGHEISLLTPDSLPEEPVPSEPAPPRRVNPTDDMALLIAGPEYHQLADEVEQMLILTVGYAPHNVHRYTFIPLETLETLLQGQPLDFLFTFSHGQVDEDGVGWLAISLLETPGISFMQASALLAEAYPDGGVRTTIIPQRVAGGGIAELWALSISSTFFSNTAGSAIDADTFAYITSCNGYPFGEALAPAKVAAWRGKVNEHYAGNLALYILDRATGHNSVRAFDPKRAAWIGVGTTDYREATIEDWLYDASLPVDPSNPAALPTKLHRPFSINDLFESLAARPHSEDPNKSYLYGLDYDIDDELRLQAVVTDSVLELHNADEPIRLTPSINDVLVGLPDTYDVNSRTLLTILGYFPEEEGTVEINGSDGSYFGGAIPRDRVTWAPERIEVTLPLKVDRSPATVTVKTASGRYSNDVPLTEHIVPFITSARWTPDGFLGVLNVQMTCDLHLRHDARLLRSFPDAKGVEGEGETVYEYLLYRQANLWVGPQTSCTASFSGEAYTGNTAPYTEIIWSGSARLDRNSFPYSAADYESVEQAAPELLLYLDAPTLLPLHIFDLDLPEPPNEPLDLLSYSGLYVPAGRWGGKQVFRSVSDDGEVTEVVTAVPLTPNHAMALAAEGVAYTLTQTLDGGSPGDYALLGHSTPINTPMVQQTKH